MRELIMDHGSEFGAHRIDEKGEWDGEFKQHILKYGIKPILAGVKHPQTNGKLEKFFDSYQRFRNFFPTFDDFIEKTANGSFLWHRKQIIWVVKI